MMRAISIIALSALVSLLSGCGCSTKREPVDEARVRMSDAAYTNLLVQTHSAQVQVASQMAAIRSEIERLGKGAEKREAVLSRRNANGNFVAVLDHLIVVNSAPHVA